MNKIIIIIAFLFVQLLFSFITKAQITSSNADGSTIAFNDSCYIFCTSGEGGSIGSLSVETPFGVNSTFYWEKYDSLTNVFSPYGTLNLNDTLQSTINNLDDGCYRVTIESEGNSTSIKAWVLHNWIRVTKAEIPDSTSNCDGFIILADFEYAKLNVYNTVTGEWRDARNPNIEFEIEWRQDGKLVRSYLSPQIDLPIPSDTPVPYLLTIEDEFGCIAEGRVDYDSKVTKADFEDPDPMEGEAILEVTFTNTSINYDSAYWFFYKDSYQISKELEETGGEQVDSIAFILTEDSPIYEYERSGQYRVKLVTVKENITGNCYDTLFMDPGTFIDVDTSLVDAPNVFTPNGDGVNDVFVVKTKSLESLNIKIFNRWGGLVHSWKNDYVMSNEDTYLNSVWDGRIGNSMAAPGVYYYVIQYKGRDIYQSDGYRYGKRVREGNQVKGTKTGFIHLFRSKN